MNLPHLTQEELGWLVACLLFLNNFLNNLLVKIPNLKGNTTFECLANTIDALVSTLKGVKSTPNPTIIVATNTYLS